MTWLLSGGMNEWGNKGFKFNQLQFMDEMKFFAESKNQIDSLVQTVHIFSEAIGKPFGIKKCGLPITEKGKLITTW